MNATITRSELNRKLLSADRPTLVEALPEKYYADKHLPNALTCMFHEGGFVFHEFAKRINLPGRHLGIAALAQFVPIHFQEKCAVTV
jgi:hypothetical protein